MTLVCPSCGSENPDGAIYCNKCAARLTSPSQPKSSLKKCPRCGVWNDLVRPVCANCGENLTFVEATPVPAPSGPTTSYCAWCGSPVGSDDRLCPTCRRDPRGHRPTVANVDVPWPAEPPAPSNKPKIAGVLLVGAGILEIVAAMRVWSVDVSGAGLPPEVNISGFVAACGTIIFVMGLAALMGSYAAFRKNSFLLAVTASVAGMLGLGVYDLGSVLSLIALILIVLARDEFKH